MRQWPRTALYTGIGIGIVVCVIVGIFFLTILLSVSNQPDYQYPGGFPGSFTTGKAP